MNCDQVQKMLPGYLEGGLSKTENALIAKHLTACADCRAVFAEYEQARKMVGSLEEVEPPPGFAGRIMARVEEEEGRRRGLAGKLFYPLHIKVPVQALAAVAVAVLAIQAYRTVEPEKQPVPPAAVTAAPGPKEEPEKKEDLREETARPEKKAARAVEPEARSAERAAKDAPASPPPAAAPPAERRQRKGEAAAPLQAPAAARDAEKADVSFGGKVAKMETKAKAPAPSREAASLQKAPPLFLTLKAEDPVWAGEKVQDLLRELGGIRIETNRLGDGEIITAELNPEKLPVLINFLRSIGQLPETEQVFESSTSSISLRIEIFRR
jgi:hypothetical protein